MESCEEYVIERFSERFIPRALDAIFNLDMQYKGLSASAPEVITIQQAALIHRKTGDLAMLEIMKDWVYQQHCQFGSPAGSILNAQWVEISQDPASNMYIPIRYTQFLDDHRMIISAGKEYIDVIQNFIEHHEANPFSSETFEDLHHYLIDQNENLKAELAHGRKQHGFLYAIAEQKDLDLSRIQDSTTEFRKNTKDEIITKYVHISQDIRSVNFGTCIDGKIVSVAACNEAHDPDIHAEEIEVLTHVAVSAGFTKLAQEMMIICFRG